MTDFGLSMYKVKPGLKCYLYISEYGNILDELMRLSFNVSSYVKTIRHPFSEVDLSIIMGVSNEAQSIVVRDCEKLSPYELLALETFLSQPRIKNLSVFIVGQPCSGEAFDKLRARVSRQGLLIEASDPNTTLSQKHLSEWFGDQCIIQVSDAYAICQRLSWNLGDIFWVMKSYQSISAGKQLDTITSRKVLQTCCPDTVVENAYSLLMQKKAKEAFAFVSSMNYNETLRLFKRLDSSLTDLSLIKPYIVSGLSAKAVADKSGVHIVKVLKLKDYVSRYSDSTIKGCQNLLDFGFDNLYQPEIAKVVTSLWS